MGWADVFDETGMRVASRALLISRGATGRILTNAVRSGALVRARRDHYMLPAEQRALIDATRVGGRLGCVSALRAAGLFGIDDGLRHIHVTRGMTRMRSTRSRFIPLTDETREGVELHWWPLSEPENATKHAVGIIDALAQAVRCQHPWLALASIDNAIFTGVISSNDLAAIFRSVPERHQSLATKVNGRAEAGQETVLRMILESIGLDYDIQVNLPEVGRVDFVVEGCLVVEADSRLAHDGWERHVEDRRRDLQLAKQGFMSLRPAYQHTMHEAALVAESILGLLSQSRNFRCTIG